MQMYLEKIEDWMMALMMAPHKCKYIVFTPDK